MSAKNEYMLLFRHTNTSDTLSPEEMQKVAEQMMAWFKRLTDEGVCLGGRPLGDEGKVVSGKNGRVVADGPFAESKEAVGGYFMLQLDTFEQAVAIAKECPMLNHGGKVEVRQVLEKCPHTNVAIPDTELAAATA
ncbi:MAG TPA: YciI family protein [Candidatus Sulfotelmatobacter sp.]|nr:YciI family protein [Candidatus Sulfotelmatobacter sp.]